jgi:hypothetical protein
MIQWSSAYHLSFTRRTFTLRSPNHRVAELRFELWDFKVHFEVTFSHTHLLPGKDGNQLRLQGACTLVSLWDNIY